MKTFPMSRTHVRVALLLAATLALAGCGPGSLPVARIGARTITVDDLTAMARGNEESFPPDPEQGRALFLEKVVEQELLREQGRALGYDTLASIRKLRASIEEGML